MVVAISPPTTFVHAKFNACKQYIAHSGSFKFHRLILMTNNKLYNPTQTLTQMLYVKHLDHNYALHLRHILINGAILIGAAPILINITGTKRFCHWTFNHPFWDTSCLISLLALRRNILSNTGNLINECVFFFWNQNRKEY